MEKENRISDEGFVAEDGNFYEWPRPMRGTFETPEARQATIQEAQRIVGQPEVYGERLVGLNQHYLHVLTGRTFRKGKWKR